MGGCGSGNHWGRGGKKLTSTMLALDIKRLTKLGMLVPGKASISNWSRRGVKVGSILLLCYEDRVVLDYDHTSHKSDTERLVYEVMFDYTACHFGGKRPWFTCPGSGCGRRVAVLYGGKYFACRHCHDLVHASTRENSEDRCYRKADRINDKLGWEGGPFAGCGEKPSKMRWETYISLLKKRRYYADRYLFDSVAKIQNSMRRRKG